MSDYDGRIVRAAIAWHVHHSPLEEPYDKSPRADRQREEMRVNATRRLHEVVAEYLAVLDAR